MTNGLMLQAGGTLRTDHIYVERTHDKTLLDLLLKQQYVNVLAPRQMGKSSLMVRTTEHLRKRSIRFSTIDLASELGTPATLSEYYQGLLLKISRDLDLDADIERFWNTQNVGTVNQQLLRFFRDVVARQIANPIVIFLDEIDSTLKLSYTDDLFTAIRGMYNERQLVPAYGRITFCLLGVATPNELIKSRRTTAYNIGHSLELRDFDKTLDDLSPLSRSLSNDSNVGTALIDRILYWTNGQPYLTVKLCIDMKAKDANAARDVDIHVEETFRSLQQLTGDIHFAQVLRFVQERLTDNFSTLQLYANILKGAKERDQTTLTHAELKLSGLIKRDPDGYLIVRNRIYQRLFDQTWVERARPNRILAQYRRSAVIAWGSAAASVAAFGLLFVLWQSFIIVPGWDGALAQVRLMMLKIDVSRDGPALVVRFPNFATQGDLEAAAPQFKVLQPAKLTFILSAVHDIAPLHGITSLQNLDFDYSREIADISSLEQLTKLEVLNSSHTRVSDISSLRNLMQLRVLNLSNTKVEDLLPLSKLSSLQDLNLSETPVANISPFANLLLLKTLNLSVTGVSDLSPLEGLKNLEQLNLSRTPASDISALAKLASLRELDLSETYVEDISPLRTLTQLQKLNLTKAHRVTPRSIAELHNAFKEAGKTLQISR